MEYPTAQAYFDSLGFTEEDVKTVRGIVQGTLKKMVVFYGPGKEGKTTLVRLLALIADACNLPFSLDRRWCHTVPTFYVCEETGDVPPPERWLRGHTVVVMTNERPRLPANDDGVVVLQFTKKQTGTLVVTSEFVSMVKKFLWAHGDTWRAY